VLYVFSNFLSPIDDFSNLPFRLLCQRYGAEAVCVPLVNSTAIAYDPAKASIVDAHLHERNIGVQLVGNVPEDIGKSASVIEERFPFVSWYNINCGCPSVRTMKCGGGSAMLAFPEKIALSVSELKRRTDKPVSVKIRIKNDLSGTLAVCRLIERAGADFMILHGRTAAQGYSGKADWELIKAVKEGVGVPLVGNGDIASASEGERLVEEGYCDSYMVARAAMANPMFFSGKEGKTLEERLALIEEYLGICGRYGEPQIGDAKLKAVNMISGIPNAAAMRNHLCRAKSIEEILTIKDRFGEGASPL
jgi:tRNA-dihydrouridine synthase B